MGSGLRETVQYKVKELYLITEKGTVDITNIFDELHIFQNMFTPCMSGSVLIRDSNNIIENLKLDGNEYIKIFIVKGEDTPDYLEFEKIFKINNIPEIIKTNLMSKIFRIHFLSEEYLLSETQKISKSYSGLYSEFIQNILTEYLKIPNTKPKGGKSGIFNITASTGINDVAVPAMTPFDTIEWMLLRAVYKNLPSFVFFETQYGYNLTPLDILYNDPPVATLNFSPKNIDGNIGNEFLGVRDFKVLSSFDIAKNTTDGVYAGKFLGFDLTTRTTQLSKIDYKQIFDKIQHLNKNPIVPINQNVNEKYDSRFVTYPFNLPRTTNDYVKKHDNKTSERPDNTEEYYFQRKALLNGLLQRRIDVVLPGNFGLMVGKSVDVYFPIYSSNQKDTEFYDKEMSGKYLIIAARHILRYDRHETILQIATDSTNNG